MLASAWLPSRKLSRCTRATRGATAMAALGLVFMGAIVLPVYLVPALTGCSRLGWRPSLIRAAPLPCGPRSAGGTRPLGAKAGEPDG